MNQNKTLTNIFNKWAENYQERFMNVELYADSLDFLCNSISKKNAKVLDVACGPGNISRYLLDKRPDFKLLGIDLAEEMLQLAAVNNPEAEFKTMDCRDLLSLDREFDAVVCGFCLPYLSREDAQQLFRDASQMLQTGGMLYISTMEDDYASSGLRKSSDGKDELYMYFHEADTLKQSLENAGFKLTYEDRKRYPGPDGKETVDVLLIAQKT